MALGLRDGVLIENQPVGLASGKAHIKILEVKGESLNRNLRLGLAGGKVHKNGGPGRT